MHRCTGHYSHHILTLHTRTAVTVTWTFISTAPPTTTSASITHLSSPHLSYLTLPHLTSLTSPHRTLLSHHPSHPHPHHITSTSTSTSTPISISNHQFHNHHRFHNQPLYITCSDTHALPCHVKSSQAIITTAACLPNCLGS